MSGVVKGVGKVFKKVGKVLQPLLKPALIGAGIVFGGLALGSAATAAGLAAPGAVPTLGSVFGGGAATSGVASGAINAIGTGTLGGGPKLAGGALLGMKAKAAAAAAAGGAPALTGGLPGGAGPLGAAGGQIATALSRTLPAATTDIGGANLGGGTELAMSPLADRFTSQAAESGGILGRIEDWMKAHPNLAKYGGGALAAGAKGAGAAMLAKELQDEYWERRRDELEFRHPKLTAEGSAIPGMDMSGRGTMPGDIASRTSATGGRPVGPIANAPAMSLPEAGLANAPNLPLGQGNIPVPGLERYLKQAQSGGSGISPFPTGVPIAGFELPYYT